MRLYWEVQAAGLWSPPQFEEDYRSQLKGYLELNEFEGVLATVNRLWRAHGTGLFNRGCLACCVCCCVLTMRKDNLEALIVIRDYLQSINREVYLPRRMCWMLLNETEDGEEEEDVILALEIADLIDQQPDKRRQSFEQVRG